MSFLAIISSLVGLIGPISHIMVVQNVSERLAMAIGHALLISHMHNKNNVCKKSRKHKGHYGTSGGILQEF